MPPSYVWLLTTIGPQEVGWWFRTRSPHLTNDRVHCSTHEQHEIKGGPHAAIFPSVQQPQSTVRPEGRQNLKSEAKYTSWKQKLRTDELNELRGAENAGGLHDWYNVLKQKSSRDIWGKGIELSWVELILWPTINRPIRLGVGHPFGAHDQIFLFPFFCRKIALLFVLGRPLWREDVSIICSELSLCCYRRSVGLSVLVSGTPLGPMTRFFFFLSFAGQLLCSSTWGALSDEKTGL
jgi:hypothetical protein